MPVPAIVTCAVDVAVPDGTYRTRIVQLDVATGLMTKPDTQVPPVIEKVPMPAVLVIVGAAVRVSGPAFAPVAVLVTVMVPFFVVVLAVPVVNAGVGPANAAVAPKTVNVTALEVPLGVVTVTLWAPSPAVRATVKVAVTV